MKLGAMCGDHGSFVCAAFGMSHQSTYVWVGQMAFLLYHQGYPQAMYSDSPGRLPIAVLSGGSSMIGFPEMKLH